MPSCRASTSRLRHIRQEVSDRNGHRNLGPGTDLAVVRRLTMRYFIDYRVNGGAARDNRAVVAYEAL